MGHLGGQTPRPIKKIYIDKKKHFFTDLPILSFQMFAPQVGGGGGAIVPCATVFNSSVILKGNVQLYIWRQQVPKYFHFTCAWALIRTYMQLFPTIQSPSNQPPPSPIPFRATASHCLPPAVEFSQVANLPPPPPTPI